MTRATATSQRVDTDGYGQHDTGDHKAPGGLEVEQGEFVGDGGVHEGAEESREGATSSAEEAGPTDQLLPRWRSVDCGYLAEVRRPLTRPSQGRPDLPLRRRLHMDDFKAADPAQRVKIIILSDDRQLVSGGSCRNP